MRKEIKVGDKVIVKKPQLNVANNTIIDVGEICTVEEIIKTSELSAVLKIKTSTGVWGYVNRNMVVKESHKRRPRITRHRKGRPTCRKTHPASDG